MPISLSPSRPRTGITKFTNGLVLKGTELVAEDIWISSETGKILRSQEIFYEQRRIPDTTIDLHGQILAPGFIDVQFNGAFGYDFATIPADMADYAKGLQRLNRQLVRTGVTSYLPTIPSQHASVYHQALPYLAPSGTSRDATLGAESLGAHCEGPFISRTKNGIHNLSVLRDAPSGLASLESCYGAANLSSPSPSIRMITLAPEVPGISSTIPHLTARGIITSIGHTEATFEQTSSALSSGATMLTHLFNAMRPLHHRNPGPFGTLGTPHGTPRPYYGIISDGIHLHPTTVQLAYHAHPTGFILVTDAMKTVGQPDGTYPWTNGERFVKRGALLTLEGSDTIAGSSASLLECVVNFWNFSNVPLPEALRAVTATPAEMLGLKGVKGCLEPGADADLVVLERCEGEGGDGRDGERGLRVRQVWKFGARVWDEDGGEEREA